MAAFEMVFQFYRTGLQFSQRDAYEEAREREPHGSENYRVSTAAIVALAQQMTFVSDWGRVSDEPDALVQQLGYFLGEGIPLIAVQKYTDELPLIGHFRVIIGIENGDVVLHDPCTETGGSAVHWPLAKMIDYWRPTGENVTGGVAIFVTGSELSANPLDMTTRR